MKILLTNDDGIDAPGLEALAGACAHFGELIIVAPDRHLSGCSHQATTDRPLALVDLGGARYSLDGTPVDCTRVALAHLAPDVDWVVSGINDGGNLGADVYMSGTVAAVREATLLGKPAIAISRYRRRGGWVDWPTASQWTRRVLERLLSEPPGGRSCWNVNLPDPDDRAGRPSIVDCDVDPHPLPVRYDLVDGTLRYGGVYRDRRREPAHDVDICFSGNIAVSRLQLHEPRR